MVNFKISNSINRIKYCYRYANRYAHRLLSVLSIRLLLSYTPFWKFILAISIVIVSLFFAPRDRILVGATVFYATMLYLEDRFEYPALFARTGNSIRRSRDVPLDTISVSIDVVNRGPKSAKDITARGRVYDPQSGTATWWVEADDEDINEPIEPGRNRENVQIFIDPDMIERANVVGYDDGFSDNAWVEIEVNTPDQLVTSYSYIDLSDINILNEDYMQEGLSLMQEGIEQYKEHEQRRITEEESEDPEN